MGLLRSLYIVPIYMDTHGFQIGVCLWGLRAGAAPGTLLSEDPFPAEGPRAWAGDSPSMAGKTTPPWVLPHLEEIMEGVLAPDPLPPHPPAHSLGWRER